MKKVGLVGGISWVSTLDYYRYINEGVNKQLGGLNFAECIIYSLNYGDIQANEWPATFELLHNAAKSLERSGADAIMLCANTAHFIADELKSKIDLPIIHIVTATAAAINHQGFKKVGLLGTKFTMEMDFYRKGLADAGIEAIVPADSNDRAFIQQTLKEELGKGIVNQTTKLAYLQIIDKLIAEGAEAIILGCTEIPMLLSQKDVSIPVFDTTRIHAQAAVDFALSI